MTKGDSETTYPSPLILQVKNMNSEMLSDKPKVTRRLVAEPGLESKLTSLIWYPLYLLWEHIRDFFFLRERDTVLITNL